MDDEHADQSPSYGPTKSLAVEGLLSPGERSFSGADVLRVEDLVVGYGGGDVLRGVSISAPGAAITAVIGPNGAGKSTLLAAVVGLLRPKAGTVRLREADITGVGPRGALARGVVFVPQTRSLFKDMTVMENVELGGYTLTNRHLFNQRLAAVAEMFPVVIQHARLKAGRLSGGQQRMVEFARSLMLEPEVVLLDEPSMGLDPASLRTVYQSILKMRERGKAVVLVEQNAKAALQVADKAVLLESGVVRLSGTGREVLEHSDIGKVYLGGGVAASKA